MLNELEKLLTDDLQSLQIAISTRGGEAFVAAVPKSKSGKDFQPVALSAPWTDIDRAFWEAVANGFTEHRRPAPPAPKSEDQKAKEAKKAKSAQRPKPGKKEAPAKEEEPQLDFGF